MLLALLLWIASAFGIISWAELAERRYRQMARLSNLPHKFSPARFGWAAESRKALDRPSSDTAVESARLVAFGRMRLKYLLCLVAGVPATMIAYVGLTLLGQPFDERLLLSPWAFVVVLAEVWLLGLLEGSLRERLVTGAVGLMVVAVAILRASAT